MGKILKIHNDIVTVGNNDGTLTEIKLNDCNFNPNVGDEVCLFSSDTKTICTKIETSKHAVNKISYILLAIFLGGLGVHKFYGGRPIIGILYLLFCWTYIPLVISLVEGIIAICKQEDNNGKILV